MFPTTAGAGAGGAGGEDGRHQILTDEKFFSRLLSKEAPAANPSFRVYYGVASGSVPFLWESRPGTPKHTAAAAPPPPLLAPPPSSFLHPSQNSIKPSPKSPKRKLIRAILPKLALRGQPILSPSSDEEESDEARMSPTSTLCFGERLALKKALFSIVGHGPDHRRSA